MHLLMLTNEPYCKVLPTMFGNTLKYCSINYTLEQMSNALLTFSTVYNNKL